MDERERKEKGRARRGPTPRRKALNKRLNLLSVRLLSSTVRWVYVHVSTYGVLVEAASGAHGGTERGHDRDNDKATTEPLPMPQRHPQVVVRVALRQASFGGALGWASEPG